MKHVAVQRPTNSVTDQIFDLGRNKNRRANQTFFNEQYKSVDLVGKEIQRRILMTEAYCVKCRKKITMKDPQQVTMKNDRKATKGTCPDCSTKVFRIGG